MRFLLPLQIKMYHIFWLKRRKKKCTKMLATRVLDESVSYCQKDFCCVSFLDSRSSLNKSHIKPRRTSDNSNSGWDIGDSILEEFPCLSRCFTVLCLGSDIQSEAVAWKLKKSFRLFGAFLGTQNVIAGNEKPVSIHLYLHWFSTNGMFCWVKYLMFALYILISIQFCACAVLHKIQRVLKKITVCN